MWVCEVAISVAMIVLGVVFYVIAGTFRASFNINDIGAQAFPRLVVIAMCVLAVMLIITSFKNRNPDEKVSLGNWPILLSGIALLFVYILLMPILGYFYTTPVFVMGFMALQGYRKLPQMVLITAGFCLFVYVAFSNVLGVMLP